MRVLASDVHALGNIEMTKDFIEQVDAAGSVSPVPLGELSAVLRSGEALHRAFRPDLPADYQSYMMTMFAEGARMVQLVDDGAVCAIAVWRCFHTTYCGKRFEVDDLVTDSARRSRGYGKVMIAALDAKAKALDCDTLTLISGTPRVDAHRFYFRERFAITGFFFNRKIV